MSTELLLISGSTRAASSNTAILRRLADLAPGGFEVRLCDLLADLPAFNPDASPDQPHTAVAALRAALSRADAVVFSTPEYAGTLPGSLKNLLDWTVGTGDLYGKPVAWINVANPGRGEGAQATLRTVLGYVGAVPIDEACLRLHMPPAGSGRLEDDPDLTGALAGVYPAVAAHLSKAATRPS